MGEMGEMGPTRETRFAHLLRGGTEGNARLIGLTGLVLLVLLAIEGVTILDIRPLLPVHVFVGLLLIPPVALKLAATGYRLARYYLRTVEYVRKGPRSCSCEWWWLRAWSPPRWSSSQPVSHPPCRRVARRDRARPAQGELHRLARCIRDSRACVRTTGPGLVAADWGRDSGTSGAALRTGVVALSLLLGLTVALAVMPAAWPWLH
jgi:hypothetical protein